MNFMFRSERFAMTLMNLSLIHIFALTVSTEQMSAGGYNVKWEPSTGLPSTPTANPQIWDCFPEV